MMPGHFPTVLVFVHASRAIDVASGLDETTGVVLPDIGFQLLQRLLDGLEGERLGISLD